MDTNTSRGRLRELHGSGYEIVDGQPNIIGWKIRDVDNHKIGVVDDLLFDEDQQKVRYIVATLKDNDFDLDRRKVLIPIGIAELHETDDDVIIPTVAPWQLRALPTYSQRITDYDEQEVYTVFSAPSATTQRADRNWHKPQNFYESPTFNHDNIYRKRRTGELKDKPIDRTFRMKPGREKTEYGYDDRERSDYSDPSRTMHEQEALAASHRERQSTGTTPSSTGSTLENERLLSKIRRMQDELDELERDIRNSRSI